MKTFQFRARIEHRQAVTSFGIGTDLICSRRGGETHTSSLNTLSTPNRIIPWDKNVPTRVCCSRIPAQTGRFHRKTASIITKAGS